MICLKKLNETGFFLLWLLVFFPLAAHAEVFDKVVAKVNSEIITLSSIEERAEILRPRYAGASVSISQQKLLEESLNMIIDEKLQLQEGKKLGFIVDEDAIDAAIADIEKKNNLDSGQLQEMLEREGRSLKSYRDHIRDQISVSKITRFEIDGRVKISEKSIIKYYKENQKLFWAEGKVRARHILFISERGSSEKDKRAKLRQAKKVLREIQRGGDFSELANKYSEDVSASSGGDVGFVERGKMVREFEEAVFSLRSGQVSDIVETEYGYHIIKVEEVLPGKSLPFKEVKGRIQQVLTAQKQKEVYGDWIKELKESAFIEVTLFDDPARNKSLISGVVETGRTNGENRKELKSKNSSKRRALQEKWEAMYKSVAKSKGSSKQDKDSESPEKSMRNSKQGSELESLEQKLKHIKKLRDQNRISAQEYQKRKERLLTHL